MKLYLLAAILFLSSISFDLYAQKSKDSIAVSNKLNNNRFRIEYYSKQKDSAVHDSLYACLYANLPYEDYLFYRDYAEMAYYFIKKDDTVNAIKTLRKAVLKGLDSATMARYYGKFELFFKYLAPIIAVDYKRLINEYNSSIDTALVARYKFIEYYDQLTRNAILKNRKHSKELEEILYGMLGKIDTFNFHEVISLWEQGKGLSEKTLGRYSEEFLPILMHVSDDSSTMWKAIEKYLITQVEQSNLIIHDYLKIAARHFRDYKAGNLCDEYGFLDSNKVKNCDCDCIERVWQQKGFGSFKLFIRLKGDKRNCK